LSGLNLEEIDELYRELLSRVSARFELLSAHHGAQVSCAEGCHSCCHPELTVSEVEARLIRAHLSAHPELYQSLLELEERAPFRGERCSFLGAEGGCGIYEVRPVVCRSFGVPLLQIEDPRSGEATLSSCELNFVGDEGAELLASLSPSEWLDSSQTDTALAQLNFALHRALHRARPELDPPARVPLRASAIMSRR